jgi:hypothetical protein
MNGHRPTSGFRPASTSCVLVPPECTMCTVNLCLWVSEIALQSHGVWQLTTRQTNERFRSLACIDDSMPIDMTSSNDDDEAEYLVYRPVDVAMRPDG